MVETKNNHFWRNTQTYLDLDWYSNHSTPNQEQNKLSLKREDHKESPSQQNAPKFSTFDIRDHSKAVDYMSQSFRTTHRSVLLPWVSTPPTNGLALHDDSSHEHQHGDWPGRCWLVSWKRKKRKKEKVCENYYIYIY